MSYDCGNCSNKTASSLDAARMAGWRIWEGKSVTGKDLKVRICPTCAGVEQPEEERSWRVGCHTCYWEYEEEWDDPDGDPLSEKDAREVARDHVCEPDTWIKPPLTPEELAKLDALRSGRRVVTVPLAGVS